MKLGTPKYGFTQKKYFKLKEGDVTFRILPPMGDLADEGKWSMFYAVHYGYKNTSNKLRTFQSPEVINHSTKMIEVPDAANDRIKKLKAELEKAKAAGNKAVVEKIGPLVSGKTPMYNLDKNHYMNVIDLQGNIGVLKIRHKAKQALDAQIKKLRGQGVNPISVDDGRFFTFSRSGMGLDTTFSVSVAQESLDVPGVGQVKRDIVHKLDDTIKNRLADEASKLDKLFKKLTSEEVARIVSESDLLTGKSRAVDEILDAKTNGSDDSGSNDDGGSDETYEDNTSQSASAADVVGTQSAASPGSIGSTVSASVNTMPVASVETKAAPVSAPTQTTANTVEALSDEDFLKSLNL